MMNRIVELRRLLHATAEPSMQEVRTKQILMDFLRENTGLMVVDRGSWFYAKKISGESKPTLPPMAFRADFDAVTCGDGHAEHLCGHDGHSAILAGFALELDHRKVRRDVYLIFQPGEEIGAGGALCAELIDEVGIGEIYGIHNIPGYEKGTVLLLPGTFACASTGLEICYEGQESHAAYPEQGCNPAGSIAAIIQQMNDWIQEPHRGMVLGTVIGIEVGSRSYGVSAGKGSLRLTLRAQYQDEFDAFVGQIEKLAYQYAEQESEQNIVRKGEEQEEKTEKSGEMSIGQGSRLRCHVTRIEEFPATINYPENVEKVRQACEELGMAVAEPDEPFRWSEDFGYYLQRTQGAFLGVGCGKDHAGLHTSGYEFEDDIIEDVIQLYRKLAE